MINELRKSVSVEDFEDANQDKDKKNLNNMTPNPVKQEISNKVYEDPFKLSVVGLSSIYETTSYTDSKLIDHIQSLQ